MEKPTNPFQIHGEKHRQKFMTRLIGSLKCHDGGISAWWLAAPWWVIFTPFDSMVDGYGWYGDRGRWVKFQSKEGKVQFGEQKEGLDM